jgi:hypothetical protein
LKEHDFTQTPELPLDGTWTYYPGILSLDSVSYAAGYPVEVPGHLNQELHQRAGYGIYQATIEVVASQEMGLMINNINGAYEVYLNNQKLASVGSLGYSIETSAPYRGTILVPVTFTPNQVDTLTIRSSNFRHSRAGIDDQVILGTYEHLNYHRTLDRAFDWFLSGSLVIGSFFFIGLFLFGKREQMALYFSLFCFAYAYRIVGWGSYPLHELIDIS